MLTHELYASRIQGEGSSRTVQAPRTKKTLDISVLYVDPTQAQFGIHMVKAFGAISKQIVWVKPQQNKKQICRGKM